MDSTFVSIVAGLLKDVPFKEVVLGFSLTIYLWEQYLAWRHYNILADPKTSVPKLLTEHISAEDHKKSKAYSKDKTGFAFLTALFGQVQTVLIFTYDVLPYFWALSKEILEKAGFDGDREERHGFNKQTIGLFVTDLIKELVLGFVLAIPLVSGFIQIVKWGGDNFFFYVWLFILFSTSSPLWRMVNLRLRSTHWLRRIKFPLTKIFVVDGSKRSSHSNAYFTGLFKDKRIVMFDTLLEQADQEEVLGVLAHELGHWQLNHLMKRLVWVQCQLFAMFYLFSHLGYASVLASGLIKIHLKNLGNLNPDKYYSSWHYSHPPLVERLAAIQKGGDKSQ
ncbi:peptidase family M48-domain-containing protein [Chytridium lagenaria]|nr:peptidase family M48-domain-containing protein [Chytridium lagenaria]